MIVPIMNTEPNQQTEKVYGNHKPALGHGRGIAAANGVCSCDSSRACSCFAQSAVNATLAAQSPDGDDGEDDDDEDNDDDDNEQVHRPAHNRIPPSADVTGNPLFNNSFVSRVLIVCS